MKGLNKDDKVLYITHSGELLFWLIVILAIVAISSSTFMFKEKNDENDYQIFLQDVDGLIVGSPVRMMGIEVGHVTKIKPTNTDVYVKFIITNPDIYIPQGTKITVEFSGMAGSKSLELYPPSKDDIIDKSTQILTVTPPKRLHDALALLNDMFKKLGSIIYTTSSFGSKLENIDMPEMGKSGNLEDFVKYTDNFVENSGKKTTEIHNAIESLKETRNHAK